MAAYKFVEANMYAIMRVCASLHICISMYQIVAAMCINEQQATVEYVIYFQYLKY